MPSRLEKWGFATQEVARSRRSLATTFLSRLPYARHAALDAASPFSGESFFNAQKKLLSFFFFNVYFMAKKGIISNVI